MPLLTNSNRLRIGLELPGTIEIDVISFRSQQGQAAQNNIIATRLRRGIKVTVAPGLRFPKGAERMCSISGTNLRDVLKLGQLR